MSLNTDAKTLSDSETQWQAVYSSAWLNLEFTLMTKTHWWVFRIRYAIRLLFRCRNIGMQLMSVGGGGRTPMGSELPLSMRTVHTLTVFTWKPKEFHNAVTQCLLCINSLKCINHIKHGLLTSSVERIFPLEWEHCAQMPSTSQGRLTELIQVCFLRAVEHYVFLCLPKLHHIFKITFFSIHFSLYLWSM